MPHDITATIYQQTRNGYKYYGTTILDVSELAAYRITLDRYFGWHRIVRWEGDTEVVIETARSESDRRMDSFMSELGA